MKLSVNSRLFHDEILARQHLEALRWPKGPVCPHCGVEKGATALDGKAHRPGLYQCNECRKQFSVTVGTVFERSKVPLSKIHGRRLTYRPVA
jgi:transposase-like protein